MARGTYFYDQKRTQRPKRYRKVPDDASVAGDRGYPVRKISVLSRVSSASGESLFRRPKSALKAPSSERTPLNEVPPSSPSKPKSLGFPPVDSGGGGGGRKRLVSHLDPSEASWITPGKEKLLHSIEEEDKSQDRSVKFFSNFDEAKFAATGILSQLVKVLDAKTGPEEVEFPTELICNLRKDFDDLSEDVVVEKRTWQTDCYIDWERQSRHPFFESPPEDRDLVCSALHDSVHVLITKQQQKKRVKMASQYGPEGKRGSMAARKGSASRPVSSMSIHSEALGSEFMFGESVAETDDGFDFLPPGLGVRTPTTPLLQYRGEFLTAHYEDMKSPTRLEKNQKMKMAAKKINIFRKKKTPKEKEQVTEEEAPDDSQKRASTASIIKRGEALIPFAMSRPECEEQGWLVEPDDRQDPEGVTLIKWIQARLKAVIKQKNEDKFTAQLRGEDGPLTLRYYNDMHHRSHHSRPRVPQAHITIPLPPGVQPGVTAMRLSLPSSEHQPDDQRKKFITILPDGSGALYYRSGRPAIVLSRKGDGTKGLITFAFSDSIPQRILAYFSPNGKMCCYHPNGELHLLTDRNGGTLYNEDGHTVRQWVWPEPHYKLPVSVAITLNESLSFRCTSLNFAFLHYTSGSVNHKISVAPPLDIRTVVGGGVEGEEDCTLKSIAPFSSNTAFNLLPGKDNSKKPHTQLKSLKSVDLDSSSQLENEDELSIELRSYKTRVKCTVDEWMAHYRRFLGINPRTPSPLANSRTSFAFSSGPPSRLQSSRAQPRPQSHTRHRTHPLTSSRPASQLSALSRSPPCSPTPDLGTSNIGLVYDRPPSRVKFHTVQHPLPITAIMKGVDRHLNAKKLGCPVALRAMIKMRQSAPPPCKCDKRHIPAITDVEYDRYLQTHVPKDQLVVVCVCSDPLLSKPGAGSVLGTLSTLYTRLNKNRSSPCERSAADPYRIVCYDLATAGGKVGEPPSLVSRHGIAANMVLVYWNAKLVFAGGKFNGYGVALKDFAREVETIKRRISKGQFLPNDFKFRSVIEADPVGMTTAQSISEFSDDMLSLSASGLWASQSSFTKLHGSMTGLEGSFLKYSKPES